MTTDPTARAQSTPALDAVLNEAERVAREESGRCTGDPCEGCEAGRRVSRARAELSALRTSTPGPVAVPEGGWKPNRFEHEGVVRALVTEEGRLTEIIESASPFSDRWHVERVHYAEHDREMIRRHLNTLHAPREDAPRPDLVTARAHHVPGAENFNALLDDVLVDPEAREAFETAQAELVVAPLPTEAGAVLVAWFGEQPVPSVIALGENGWYFVKSKSPLIVGSERHVRRWVHLLPAADQRARDEGTVREEIIAALHADLDENHDEHPEGTCDLCDWAGNIQSIVDGSR